ncbi:multidrug and toxin extrusion protein 1 isoform X2 [Sphaeramia orbicularis]|uniref:multidrug and toxin extrusion protein 1 isoform X2 n=1 Tax=Sphaeramia orbicularis TaxID=375764 RepID=UPI00117C828D|nr:multidrug and toxin extrusion protein 1-like isoform X2 [Sphaeramia orbicularis]
MEKLGSPDPADPSQGAGLVAGVSVAKTAGVEGDEAAVSSKLFRCACVRRWLPLAYREELYHVLRLTGPLTINLTTTSTGYGLTVACDTLISQTFGSKNMKRVGVILQRSSLILLLFCLPCWALLINSYNLLSLMQQEDEVARIAQLYVMAFLPAVPAMFLHQLQVTYLQNQGIILPQMYTAAAANIFNLGVNYVLIISLQLGVVGSAIANGLSQIIICLLLFAYIRWRKLHVQTWGGWSTECLQEWGSYMKLAIPSVFMICFEWWIWEIGGFLAGSLGEVDLAAQHVILELSAITYMFPLGVYAAACVRVGNALGAGNTARAIVTCKVSLFLSGVLAVLQGIVIASSKSVIGYIFTSDDKIVEIVSQNLTVYTFVQLFDAVLCVCSGILVGAGMQKIAAFSNLVSYYCIGLPVGIALMFAAQLRTLGLWLGLLICVILEMGFFLVLIFKLDWKKVTRKALKRAGMKVLVTPKRPVSTVLNEGMVPDFTVSNNTAQMDGEEAPTTEGYSSVNTQDQEVKVVHEAEGNSTNTGGAEKDAEQSKNTAKSKPQEPLSVTQLILRRGLTVLISVLILAVGVGFHIAFPAPEPSAHIRANFTLNWANDSTPTPLLPLDLTTNQ